MRPATTAYVAGAGVLGLPVLTVALFLGSGAADPPPAGGICTIATGTVGGADDGGQPGSASTTVTTAQTEHARTIAAAAKSAGLSQQAAAVGIMVAMQESTLRNLANTTVPESLNYPNEGSGHDHDSVGVFQQRPSAGWGTVAQLMDPGYASLKFFGVLKTVPGWESMPAWQAAQKVQRSADGTLYAQWEALGKSLAAAVWDGASGTLTCTAGTDVTGGGGSFAPEACSVRPDPTNGRGCLTPRTANIATQLMAQGWDLSCWDAHAWNPTSDHPSGRACDAFPGRGGVLPNAAEKAKGDALAASLQASASQTGISYLIWYGRIWSVERADEGWRPYSGGGVYDPASITGGHYDHVHLSVK